MWSLAKEKRDRKTGRSITTWPLYIILIVFFILYVVYQARPTIAVIFGIIIFAMIVALVAIEIINGSSEEGKLKNALEVVVAIVLVVAIWYAMQWLLHTRYPIDAVPSCSMLPYLQRGDMIILQGVAQPSQIHAPEVKMTQAQVQQMISNAMNESLECVAYKISASSVNVSLILQPGYSLGIYEQEPNGGRIISNSSQPGPIRYQCGVAYLQFTNGTTLQEAYTKAIVIGNTTITGDQNNSVVVYKTNPSDLFYREGDDYIVHRVYAVVNASGTYYYLTKGDNNPGLDIQYQNLPPSQQNIEGKVIAIIPYLGYLKLILSGTLSQPAGCNSVLKD